MRPPHDGPGPAFGFALFHDGVGADRYADRGGQSGVGEHVPVGGEHLRFRDEGLQLVIPRRGLGEDGGEVPDGPFGAVLRFGPGWVVEVHLRAGGEHGGVAGGLEDARRVVAG
jgi:hypothetical protein